ncbi:MAG TPA: SAVED domain-containing protein [Roseiflexaceae bacterium]|nr:SAVED domain-containing protein [Roseiflexaceae bacterium]
MANQVAARLSGDDYQHLYAWQFALELLMPRRAVRHVTVEDALAGSVDDVTVRYEIGSGNPDRFFQVKYHVDQRDVYSTDKLILAKPNHASLLEKFWNTWKLLVRQSPGRVVELYLVSNWTWDSQDVLKSCFDGHYNSVTDDFFSATPRSAIGKQREKWRSALNANTEEFYEFIRSMRFKLGFDCGDELQKRVEERMEYLGLESDISAIKVATGIVREWIKNGRQELDRSDFESVLRSHKLYRSADAEKCVTIYLITIKTQKFDIAPDYVLDWRDYFVGDKHKKSHQLHDPSDWNGQLLPELQALEAHINSETDCRLIRARGLSRLSAWFAFGFTFSEVARYTIEVDQQGNKWRTDAPNNRDFRLVITSNGSLPEGEILEGEGCTVAVGISVTGSLDTDVRAYLAGRTEQVAALLLLRPNRELGRDCLQNVGDVVALADSAKEHMRGFVKHWKATCLQIFYFGPSSGACFIGHRLNAVCQHIQIMEELQPGYAPSFLLQ